MDGMKIESTFMRSILSIFICKYIEKKYGCEIKMELTQPLEISCDGDEVSAKIGVEINMKRGDFHSLLAKII